ncbi:GntR family transcriptional regulator [Thiolinea disciformis]|uniref:GntR family transcriptional regulator n=1 Tax=Thiolinea disciformis TaxID=125614 RepID=UPI000375439B|nr:GntR family transcriptional regulator [Thiolinea disciformis]
MQIETYLVEGFAQQKNASLPLYDRLADVIRQGIEKGDLNTIDALPSERDLAAILSVSRVTVRKAINLLVSEGFLIQRQGSGTYIAKRLEQALKHLTSFTEDMQKRQLNAGVVWLERRIQTASAEEAKALALAEGAQVAHLYRLRTANNEPLALELAVLPQAFIPDPLLIQDSLYEYLERSEQRPVRARQRLRAIACDIEKATFLRIPAGSPVLYIERHSYLADGTPVEFTRSHYRGDSYDFISELSIATH